MIIHIDPENKPGIDPPHKSGPIVISLYLCARPDNAVDLMARDGNGDTWLIAKIDERGMGLYPSIGSETGWPLYAHGQYFRISKI